MVWDDSGPAPIRHSPTKDGGSAAVAATTAMRRRGDRVAAAALVEKMHPFGTALQSLDPLSTIMIVFCLLAY